VSQISPRPCSSPITSSAVSARPSAAAAVGSPAAVAPRRRRFHWYVKISGFAVFCWTSGASRRAAMSRSARPTLLAAPAVSALASCASTGAEARCTKKRTFGASGQRAGRKTYPVSVIGSLEP
jgi:hypothetical protein